MLEKFLQTPFIKRLFPYIKRYDRHIGIAALLFGFLFDFLTLGEPGGFIGNLVLGSYILVSAFLIVLLSLYGKTREATPSFLLFLLQFCFGNIAGGLTVLYGQSGTLQGSFLFFLVFGVFIFANEFFRQRYAFLTFHIGAWFFLALAYTSLVFPSVLKRMGDEVFLGGVFFALAAVFFLILVIYIIAPKSFSGFKKKSIITLGLISVFFIGAYFGNIIPPVPLSLEKIGIFHSIVKTDSLYKAEFEPPRWFEPFRLTSKVFSFTKGSSAYCFSSIRAPLGLSVSVYHRWEKHDEHTRTWETVNRFLFSIHGGRSLGYRGYTQKFALEEGKWRCSVETERGALIGRTTFMVKDAPPASLLKIRF